MTKKNRTYMFIRRNINRSRSGKQSKEMKYAIKQGWIRISREKMFGNVRRTIIREK